MILFIDTSALVKLYIVEPGSDQMREAVRYASVAVSTLTFAEIHATFARRKREEFLLPAELKELHLHFADDWRGLFQVPLGDDILRLIPELCSRYPLRGADAVQLASALLLRDEGLEVTFAGSDRRLLEAAAAAKLPVFDPVQEVALSPPPTTSSPTAQIQRYDRLVDCVTAAIARLPASSTTKRHLQVLFGFLQAFAREAEQPSSFPSLRSLAETLHIPRALLTGLLTQLGEIIQGCRMSVGEE